MWRKIILAYCVILLMSTGLMGQNVPMSTEAIPHSGDSLFYLTDNLPYRILMSSPGEDQFWNFSSLLAPYIKSQEARSTEKDLDAKLQIGNSSDGWSYFEPQAKGLIWKGADRWPVGKTMVNRKWWSVEGVPLPSWDMNYSEDIDFESVYETTLSLHEIPEGWKSALPKGTDSIRVSALINRSMMVDATGTILLAGGSRHDVRRLRVEDLVNKKLWAIGKTGGWQDITSLTRLEDFLPERQLSYYFVAREDQGIVCTVFMDKDGKPNRVDYLVPKEQVKYYKKISSTQWLLAYPNPALAVVRFKFLEIPPGKYTIRFYDILLRKLLEREYEVTGNETVEININHFSKGTYLYSLIDEKGNKLVTKRLIVIKP